MFNDLYNKEKVYKNYVGGKWIESTSLQTIDIISPIDKSLVGRVQAMNQDDVDNVIENAKKAQISWRVVPMNKRANILNNVADILEAKIDDIADIVIREIAKDRNSAIAEIQRTADFIRFTADTAKNMPGESLPGDSFPGFKKNKISVVTRVPLGVVLAISPFNYPINLSVSKIAPAIAAGNSVVLKPATQGSISALYLAKVFEMAGLPAGVLNTITGKGSEIGDYCVTHEDIDFVNFTGSTEVGERISKITSMKPVLMELGGKDAAIILEDADLELAAKNIVGGAYSYSGQRCTAVKRVLVMESVADQLVEKLIPKVKALKMGNPLEEDDITIVPLINKKSVDFVSELIQDSIDKKAKLLVGGKIRGNLVEATLFDNVSKDMKIAWEEPFGPILPIIRVNDIQEAVEIANMSKYGLQSAVFTNDINKAFYVADRLEVGTVQVNNKTERGPDNFPFLGVKASGLGTQGIKYSIEAMSRPKAIVINLE